MKLLDLYDMREYPLPAIHDEWKDARSAEPYNHADDFMTELFEILMATINGRNDLDVVGLTPTETCRYIIRLRKACERKGTL